MIKRKALVPLGLVSLGCVLLLLHLTLAYAAPLHNYTLSGKCIKKDSKSSYHSSQEWRLPRAWR